jgi:hypothetical protein
MDIQQVALVAAEPGKANSMSASHFGVEGMPTRIAIPLRQTVLNEDRGLPPGIMTIAFAQDLVRVFLWFNAERLRSTTRRDVGSAIAAPFSRCVSMRDTVSIVSPK